MGQILLKLRHKASILLCMFMLIQGVAQELNVYTTDEPPLSYEKNGDVKGISTDIVKELMTRTKSSGSIQLLPWARAYKTAQQSRNSVVFTMARNKTREAFFHWLGPIVKKKWVLYSLHTHPLIINDLHDIKTTTVGTIRHDARATYLKEKGLEGIYELDDHNIALNMLVRGRIDLWASSDFEGPSIISANGYELSDFKVAYVIKTIESYIGISKYTPASIVKDWQNAFWDIQNEGFLEEIAKKWTAISGLALSGEKGIIEIDI